MTNAISNLDDTIDSRDVIARIEELEAEVASLWSEEQKEGTTTLEYDDWVAGSDLPECEELKSLETLAEQGEDYAPDWKYGAQLIHEDYFETVMDEMLEDCGDIPRDLPSYLTITVDYDALKQDYTELDFDGQTYYVR